MTTPYYSDEHVTLYHGDCREITEWLAADVLVTDPPYGMSYVNRRGIDVHGDDSHFMRSWAITAFGTKPGLVFGTWKVDRPGQVKQVLIWDKSGGGGFGTPGLPWGNSHEEIYVVGAWPRPVAGGRAREGGVPSISHSVIRFPVDNPHASTRVDHPTPKPVGLMETLLRKCPAGVAADPFAGAGSTLVAAKLTGRRVIGVEIDERYCEIAARRLDQGVLDFGAAS